MLRIKQMIIINKQKYKFFKINKLDDFEKRLISLDFKSSYIIFIAYEAFLSNIENTFNTYRQRSWYKRVSFILERKRNK